MKRSVLIGHPLAGGQFLGRTITLDRKNIAYFELSGCRLSCKGTIYRTDQKTVADLAAISHLRRAEGGGMASQRLVTWEAIHDNGWTTTVAQRPDGTFVAVTEDSAGLRLTEVAVTLEDARDAVRRALARCGHSECSLGCSEWAMTTGAAHSRSVDPSTDLPRTQAEAPVLPSAARERRIARHWSH